LAYPNPPGPGWQLCASGSAAPCTVPGQAGKVVQYIYAYKDLCSQAEPSYGYGGTTNEGDGFEGNTLEVCWSDDWSTGTPDQDAAIFYRTSSVDFDGGDGECTAAICPADAMVLSWGVVAAWALAWGVRRLLSQAAGSNL
jgi:hypothetical protein